MRTIPAPSGCVSCPICGAQETAVVRPYRTGALTAHEAFSQLSVRKCGRCEAAFVDPLPGDAELAAYYAERYRAERGRPLAAEALGHWDGGAARARAQHAFVCRHARRRRSWLDVGAGYGLLLDEARHEGAVTAAVEPDIRCGDCIISKRHALYRRLVEVPGRWDVVSCSHVLEHLTDPCRFLDQLRGLLDEDGYLFCEVPNETRLLEALSDLPHLLFFTETPLRRLFHNCGWEVSAIAGCGRVSEPRSWKTKLKDRVRRCSMKVATAPPRWIDRFVHPHFQYYERTELGAWLRVLARPR